MWKRVAGGLFVFSGLLTAAIAVSSRLEGFYQSDWWMSVAGGAFFVLGGVALFKRPPSADAARPPIDAEIVRVAAQRFGRVTAEEIATAAERKPKDVQRALETLRGRGLCRREDTPDGAVYLFDELVDQDNKRRYDLGRDAH